MTDNLATRLKKHRMSRGWSVAQLARRSELTESAIYYIEDGDRSPRSNTLEKIADALDITTDELLGRDISVEQAFGVETLGNTMRLPVLTTIRGGNNDEAIQAATEYLTITADQIPVDHHEHVLVLWRQLDDSLGPRILSGDALLVCLTDIHVESGQIALLWDDDANCNRARRIVDHDGDLWAYASNPDYPPLPLSPHDVVGRVIQLIAPL